MSGLIKRNSLLRNPSATQEEMDKYFDLQRTPQKFKFDEEEVKKDALEELEIEKEIREVFKLYDYDNSGTITKDELAKFIVSIGKPINNEELEDLFETVDRDHNGAISIDEFIFYLKTKVYYIPQKEVDEVINCFKAFDTDNDMKITKKELENIFKKFDLKKISQEDIDMFFDVCDKDGDGSVSYAEFVDMWKIR